MPSAVTEDESRNRMGVRSMRRHGSIRKTNKTRMVSQKLKSQVIVRAKAHKGRQDVLTWVTEIRDLVKGSFLQ